MLARAADDVEEASGALSYRGLKAGSAIGHAIAVGHGQGTKGGGSKQFYARELVDMLARAAEEDAEEDAYERGPLPCSLFSFTAKLIGGHQGLMMAPRLMHMMMITELGFYKMRWTVFPFLVPFCTSNFLNRLVIDGY